MTTEDIDSIQLLVNLKNGEKLLGVTKDKFVFNTIVSIVQFVKVNEKKFGSIAIKEILK